MQSRMPLFAPLQFSTADLAPRERVPFFREVFARQIVKVDIEPQSELPFEAEATLLALPELQLTWFMSPTPALYRRTKEIVADGDDHFVLFIDTGGSLSIAHRDREVPVTEGDAVSILHAEPAAMQFSRVDYLALMVPCAALAPLVADLDDAAARLIPRGSEALGLLTNYLTALRAGPGIADPRLANLIVTHVHDLMAIALGPTRDGAVAAKRRGVSAARLNAIKACIAANPSLPLRAIARRQHVTPRYVQMLFEAEGTSFSAYALSERLARAHRLLTDARYAGWTISAIAYSAGFGDLSHFNRRFKRRFGASPSDVRAEARRDQQAAKS